MTYVDQIAHVFFESDSVSINGEAASLLDRYAAHVQIPPGCHLIISVHADSKGPADANLELSRRRAVAVQEYRRLRGVNAPITLRFHGEARPLVEAPDGTAERQNRRVEVHVAEGDAE